MSLIEQIRQAVTSGNLVEPFTTEQMKSWVEKYGITKDDGFNYARSSLDSFLSDSDIDNDSSKNKNPLYFSSQLNTEGKKAYSLL